MVYVVISVNDQLFCVLAWYPGEKFPQGNGIFLRVAYIAFQINNNFLEFWCDQLRMVFVCVMASEYPEKFQLRQES